MDAVDLRAALERRRAELRREIGSLTAVARDPQASVAFGKRVGDGTTEAVDRLNNVGAAEELSTMLADVERALVKLDLGTHGVCDTCGASITVERLEARPWSVRCIRCAADVR